MKAVQKSTTPRLTTASRIKSALIVVITVCVGAAVSYLIAPERRHGELPTYMQDKSNGGVETLPPITKISVKYYAAIAAGLKPGKRAGAVTRENGYVDYQDAVPARLDFAWLDDGKPRRTKEGIPRGQEIEIPHSCLNDARKWIGHATPVLVTDWRLPDGGTKETMNMKAVKKRICDDHVAPDPAYDARQIEVDD